MFQNQMYYHKIFIKLQIIILKKVVGILEEKIDNKIIIIKNIKIKICDIYIYIKYIIIFIYN